MSNTSLSVSEFTEAFAGSSAMPHGNAGTLSRNLIGAFVLGATMASTAFANNQDSVAAPHDHSIASMEQSTVATSTGFKSLNSDTFKDILANQISGVYANPYDETKLLTISFRHDPLADSRILGDLKNIPGGVDGYLDQQADVDSPSIGSLHIQEGMFAKGADVNLTIIDTQSPTILQSSALTIPEPTLSTGSGSAQEYAQSFTMFHEAAHSLSHQQANVVNWLKNPFQGTDTTLTLGENSSDFAASIKTIQLMHEDGVSNDDVVSFMESLQKARQYNLNSEHHFTSPVIDLAVQLFKDDTEQFMKLDNPAIVKMTEIISEMVISHDFTPDIQAHSNGVTSLSDLNAIDAIAQDFKNLQRFVASNPDQYTIDYIINEQLTSGDPVQQAVAAKEKELLPTIGTETESSFKRIATDIYTHNAPTKSVVGGMLDASLTITSDSGIEMIRELNISHFDDFKLKAQNSLQADHLWQLDETPKNALTEMLQVSPFSTNNNSSLTEILRHSETLSAAIDNEFDNGL